MFGDRNAEWRLSEMQSQRLDSVLRHDAAKKQKAGGDDSSCTLLHQQPPAARNRRQIPKTGDTVFTLQLLWHKHSPFFCLNFLWKGQLTSSDCFQMPLYSQRRQERTRSRHWHFYYLTKRWDGKMNPPQPTQGTPASQESLLAKPSVGGQRLRLETLKEHPQHSSGGRLACGLCIDCNWQPWIKEISGTSVLCWKIEDGNASGAALVASCLLCSLW